MTNMSYVWQSVTYNHTLTVSRHISQTFCEHFHTHVTLKKSYGEMSPFSQKYQKMQITPIRVGFHMHFRRIQIQVTDMIAYAISLAMERNFECLLLTEGEKRKSIHLLFPTYKNVEFWLFIIWRLWSYMNRKKKTLQFIVQK